MFRGSLLPKSKLDGEIAEQSDSDSDANATEVIDNNTFYSIDKILNNVQAKSNPFQGLGFGGKGDVLSALSNSLKFRIGQAMTYKNQFQRVSVLYQQNLAESLEKELKKQHIMALQESKMRGNNVKKFDDPDVDEEMQYKIDKMTRFKRAKDRKVLLNNPPQKETLLQGSKDIDNEVNRYAIKSSIPGEFGIAKKASEKKKLEAETMKDMMKGQTPERSPGMNIGKQTGLMAQMLSQIKTKQLLSLDQKYHSTQINSTNGNTAAYQSQPGPNNNNGVFDSYAVQKMYNYDELLTFASTETRLKQLILRLKDQEKSNQELKNQVQKVKSDLNFKQQMLDKEKALAINQNLEEIMRDINMLVNESKQLKEQQGVSTISVIHAKERITNNLFQT